MHIILYGSVAVAVACMLLDVFLTGKDLIKICPTGVLINLVMCVYSLIVGVFVAINQDTTISLVKTYATFSLICMVICYVSKEDGSIDWIIYTLVAVNVVVALFTTFKGYEFPGYGYVLGPEQNPNQLGVALITGLFSLAYLSLKKEGRALLYVALAVLILFAVVNSGSRKSLISAGIILVLWLGPFFVKQWTNGGAGKRIFLVAAVLLALVGIFIYLTTTFTNTDIFKRMTQLGDDEEFSSRQRKLYYFYAWDYFQEHPLFGIGLGQFIYWNPFHQISHSTYAEAISCWGFVGCLIYFLPVLYAVVSSVAFVFIARQRYIARIILTMLITELFLGIGQIWFYEIEHLIVWTIIYLILEELGKDLVYTPKGTYKYIKA